MWLTWRWLTWRRPSSDMTEAQMTAGEFPGSKILSFRSVFGVVRNLEVPACSCFCCRTELSAGSVCLTLVRMKMTTSARVLKGDQTTKPSLWRVFEVNRDFKTSLTIREAEDQPSASFRVARRCQRLSRARPRESRQGCRQRHFHNDDV